MPHASSPRTSTAQPSEHTSLLEKRRLEHHEGDVVIVGAGIAGCALAVALGKQGRSVLLLERSLKEPDRIVGELLQPGGVQALEKLGLASVLEDIDAIRVDGYQVVYHGEPVHIPYPENLLDESGRKPTGRSFHHGRVIQKLREAARSTPNVTVVETTVTDLTRDEYTSNVLGVECKTSGQKDYFFAPLTVVCDGYASKFRKAHSTLTPRVRSKFYGLELIDAKLPRAHHGIVVLGDHPPILIYQIGTHETRMLVDVPDNCATASPAAGGIMNHLRTVVLPALPAETRPSFEKALEAGSVRSMPNSWLPPTQNRTPGLLVLGDAMNMRHPLTGGGMTVAYNDVVLLADLLSLQNVPRLDDTRAVLRQLKTFHWRRKDVTSVINILAQALYSLFAANETNLRALQRGCFRYFQRGGECIDGPVGLLGGIIRNPLVLVNHFFSVALLAIWVDASSYPWVLLPFMLVIRGVSLLYTACVVIVPYIWAEVKS